MSLSSCMVLGCHVSCPQKKNAPWHMGAEIFFKKMPKHAMLPRLIAANAKVPQTLHKHTRKKKTKR